MNARRGRRAWSWGRPVLALLLAGAVAGGCRRPGTPEEQVRATIARAAEAAEEKDARTLAGLISEHFAGPDDADKPSVMALLTLELRRYPEIHVLLRVPSVAFPEPGRAETTVLAGLASLPLKTPDDLTRVAADLYRFELVLAEESKREWRVVSAKWSVVRPADFF